MRVDARVTTDWLAAHLSDVRVVDLRWYLGGKDARAEYDRGHIPGAVFIDLDRDLSGDPTRGPGRHPLPAPAHFEAAMARAGIGADTDVVVYDAAAGSIAARLWYLLRLFGHRAGVAVLDGGLPRWVAEGRPLETGVPAVATSGFRADPARIASWVVDRVAVDAARRDPNVLLLDARAPERYRGDAEPIDPRPEIGRAHV